LPQSLLSYESIRGLSPNTKDKVHTIKLEYFKSENVWVSLNTSSHMGNRFKEE